MPAQTATPPAARQNGTPVTQARIVISDPVPAEALEILRQAGEVTAREDFSRDELIAALRDADALIVRSGTKVTADLIAEARRLRVIGRAGVGVDNIDVKAATQKGIIVVNSPEGNTMSAAEHTLALMLALLRHVPRAAESLRRGEWKRKQFTGSEMYHKTVGVVGLGKIGREVAARVQSFQARVVAFDPFTTAEHAAALDIELMDLESLLKTADVITIHTPLNAQTRGLIGREQMAMMKKGARIVNCARGGIVDEEALHEALTRGHLGGAALDVFVDEPPTGSPLPALDNVVATPHLGASTSEAQLNVAIDVAEQVVDVLQGRPARAAVNIPSLPAEQMAQLEPYLSLGEQIGSFLAQIASGAIRSVEVTYAGDIGKLRTEPLTCSILKGMLSVGQCETVNYVNAPFIAQERGIQVKEARSHQARDYVNLITLSVATESETRTCEGTIFGAHEIGRPPERSEGGTSREASGKKEVRSAPPPLPASRIVAVDGHRMDMNPVGHKLLTWQEDQPGVVGRIGTVLGTHNINIAEMQVGRDHPRGQALMVLSIDESVGAALLEKIRAMEGIRDARVVTLG